MIYICGVYWGYSCVTSIYFLSLSLFLFIPAWSYRHRDEKIQADINKLYDTRPTAPSNGQNGHRTNGAYAVNPSETMADGGAGSKEHAVPEFDLNHSSNVTAVLDKTAILNCRVKNVGNKTVSAKLTNIFFVAFTWLEKSEMFTVA